jgi:hypothetical protein
MNGKNGRFKVKLSLVFERHSYENIKGRRHLGDVCTVIMVQISRCYNYMRHEKKKLAIT